ncbi:MAG: hypothetical protein ACK42C_04020 [Aquificaceae bacterium]|jgi:chromosome segregation ATPase|uniref:hypothetical protein n=1 Tax=Hydrogenobacter sp. Uz 6-8 TaxID=3384828 RepID=UPI000F179C24|nr:MAG: hypothetical protein D6804_00800 [Aquificota bacterium]
MVGTLPPEVVMKLQEKLGREEALEFIKALDESLKELSLQRKIELKEELTKELVTKADLREEIAKLREEIARLEGQIAEVRAETSSIKSEIKRLESYIKIVIVLFLIAIALYSPVFFELVKMLVKI